MGVLFMFDFLRKKTQKPAEPVQKAPVLSSWHYSKAENKMVPCASTPCRLHGADDVMATDARDATIKMNQKILAYQKYKQAQANKNGIGMTNGNNPEPDPETMNNDEFRDTMFGDNAHAHVISCNPMKIGNGSYVPVMHNSQDWDEIIEFARECNYCHAEGRLTEDDGRKVDCPKCHRLKYAAHISGSPSEMVLYQHVKDSEDERFHAFVKAHPDEFNDYMIHAMMAGCYLADDGEKKIYSSDYKRNPKQAIASDPDKFLQMIRMKKQQYDAEMQGKKTERPFAVSDGNRVRKIYGMLPDLYISKISRFKDRKTGEQKVIAIGQNRVDGAMIKFFIKDNPRLRVGTRVQISGGRYVGSDFEPDGRIMHKVKASVLAIAER